MLVFSMDIGNWIRRKKAKAKTTKTKAKTTKTKAKTTKTKAKTTKTKVTKVTKTKATMHVSRCKNVTFFHVHN